MADKVPIKGSFDSAGDADGLAEFVSGDTLGYAHGGTGLAVLGSALQYLRTNSAANAMEWGTVAADIEAVVAGDGLSGGGTSGSPTIDLDLNELTAAAVNVANDSIAIIDADDSNDNKKESIADLITAVAGNGLTPSSGTLALDLNELTAAGVAVANDFIAIIDSDDSNASKKESIADLITAVAGTGLGASSGVLSVAASQAITALTGGDLTIYEDANNADVSLKMGTSATEALSIEVLNGASNKIAEEIKIKTSTASTTGNHGKISIYIDDTEIMDIDDGGIDMASGKTVAINGTDLPTSAGGLLQAVYQQATIGIYSAGDEVHIAGLQVTITPASTDSAIMVGIGHCPIQPADRGTNPYWGMKIYRTIGSGSATEIHSAGEYGRADNEDIYANAAGYSYIDKPNTTSECVYNFYYTVNNVGSAENSGIGKGTTCTSYGLEFSGATEV